MAIISGRDPRRLAALLILAGILARLVGLGQDNLWHDEAFTGLVSPLPWGRFWPALLGDVHPPGWYLIERLSMGILGRSDLALRLPAALFSIGALFLFWWLVQRQLRGPGVHLAALAIMALSPFQVYYAQEARMYAALTLAALLILAGILERRPWLFAGGAVLGCWLHNLGGVYVLAGMLGLLTVIRSGEELDRWIVPGLVGVLAAGPAIAWTSYQVHQLRPGYWIIDRSIGSWLYHAVFCQFIGGGMIDSRLSWGAATAALGLGLWGLVAGIRSRSWPALALGWAPGLVMLAVSQVRPMLLSRTLIGSGPALYMLAGQALGSWRKRVAAALVLAPLLVSALGNHYLTSRRGDFGELVAHLRELEPAAVLHSQTGAWIVLSWHDPDHTHYVWSGGAHGLANAVSDQTADALGMVRAELDQLPRPTAVIFADYALVSPEERSSLLGELEAVGAELVYVAADDPIQRIDLWLID